MVDTYTFDQIKVRELLRQNAPYVYSRIKKIEIQANLQKKIDLKQQNLSVPPVQENDEAAEFQRFLNEEDSKNNIPTGRTEGVGSQIKPSD